MNTKLTLLVVFGTAGFVTLNNRKVEISKYAVNLLIEDQHFTFMTENAEDRTDLEQTLLDFGFANSTGFQFEGVRNVDFKLGGMSQRMEAIREVRRGRFSDELKASMIKEIMEDEKRAVKTWNSEKAKVLEFLENLGAKPKSASQPILTPAIQNADEFDPFADDDEKARLAAEASKGQKPKEQKAS